MSNFLEVIGSVNPAPYALHLLKLAAIEAAEDDVRREAREAGAREAVLGAKDGPCCRPDEGETPCVACDPPDLSPDEPAWSPSEADEAARMAWVREYDGRRWDERMADDAEQARHELRRDEANARLAAGVFAAAKAGTFRQLLADLANAFRDHLDDDLAWVGNKLADLHDRACYLEAASGEQYSDREDAMLDAVLAAHAGR